MKLILLDENFALALYYRLLNAGFAVEHIITLGQRGLPDTAIRQRIATEALVFLTQDTEFETVPIHFAGTVVISRVRQSLPIANRVEIWFNAITAFIAHQPPGKLFELLESGEISPWAR